MISNPLLNIFLGVLPEKHSTRNVSSALSYSLLNVLPAEHLMLWAWLCFDCTAQHSAEHSANRAFGALWFWMFPLLCWSYNKVAKNGNKWHNVLLEVLEHSVSYGLVCQCLNERSSKTLGATYFWNAGLHDGSTCCQLSSLCDLFIYGLPAEMCCPNLYQVLCQQYIQCDIFKCWVKKIWLLI